MIQINEDWRIKIDDTLNVAVEHREPKKTKGKNSKYVYDENGNQEYVWKLSGYYGTVENAIKSIIHREHFIVASNNKQISLSRLYKELIEANDKLSKDVDKLIKNFHELEDQLKKQGN